MNREEREINNEYPIFYSEKQQRNFMKNKIAYHTRSGVAFASGKKYEIKAIGSEEDIKLEKSFFDIAFGNRVRIFREGSVEADGKRLNISSEMIDGVLYVSLYAVCRDVLNMYIHTDNTAISGGMIVMCDSDFELPLGGDKPEVPYVKKIGAYMMDSSPLQELNDFLFYRRPEADEIRRDYNSSKLCGTHPRLMLNENDFKQLRTNVENNERVSSFYKQLIMEANELCEKKPLEYELTDGVRLWFVANWFNSRIQILSLAFKLSGDKKYAVRAKEEMMSAAGFKDWHPEHHIDTGAMAIGFAIGYDWLYDTYSDEEKRYFEKQVYKNGYVDYLKGYRGESGYMAEGISFGNNHNAVMNSGAVTMAIAFADIYPDESFYLISGAIRACENMLHRFARNGAWYEGVPYGTMTLNFMAYHWSAMDKLFGTNYTLEYAEGMDKAADYVINMQGPAGPYTFSDAESDGACRTVIFEPSILWFAHYYNKDSIQTIWYNLFDIPVKGSELARTIMWYKAEGNSGDFVLDTDAYYPEYNIAVMRSSWKTDQTMVGIKGGKANVEHGHMDMGSFEYFRRNIRWIDDVGADNYDLHKFFWGFTRDGERWGYFRERAEAHSCLIINPDRYGEYDPNSTAKLTKGEVKPESAVYIIDMTKCFGEEKVKRALRRFDFCDNRQSLVIRDEVEMVTGVSARAYWCAYTNEDVEICGKKIILKSKSSPEKQLEMEFLCSHDFELYTTKPEPLDITKEFVYSVPTEGTRIIMQVNAEDRFRITVKLTPLEAENKSSIYDYDKTID